MRLQPWNNSIFKLKRINKSHEKNHIFDIIDLRNMLKMLASSSRRAPAHRQVTIHKCEVHTTMEIIFRNPPATCKELFKHLDIIKDYNKGLERNILITRFLFGITGYILKFDAQHSHYHTYKASIDGVFDLGFINSDPLLPITERIFIEDRKINPECLITFNMSIHHSQRSSESLATKLIKMGPKKYKRRSSPKLTYMEPLGVKCSVINGVVSFQDM